MSATTTGEPTPLTAQPVAAYQTMPTGDGMVDVYGWCAPWCNVMETYPEHGGTTVDEHGLWCEHHVSGVDVLMENGTMTRVGVALARPYEHGVYRLGAMRPGVPAVRLAVHDYDDEDERVDVCLEPGRARSLAAALIRAADELEGVNRPLTR